jgi:hypothetical protein
MVHFTQIGVLLNGTPAYLAEDRHVHLEVLDVIAEALRQIDETLLPPFSRQAVDLGRIVGTQKCLETSPADEGDIVWARRVNRVAYSRFIRGRPAIPTRLVSITLAKPSDVWLVYTAYFGTPAPKEPTDPRITEAELAESLAFWKTHALVFEESGPVDEATISTEPKW